MGKKNKDSASDSARRWRTGQINKKERKAMERYGLDPNDYAFEGQSYRHQKGSYDDMQEDFTRAARNDYDTRRGIEAMAMSGKKKAKKLAEGGLSSAADVMNANNMQAKAHRKAGMGGDFSSASDFAGVSYRAVERDRRKHDESIDKRIGDAIPKDEPKDKIEEDMDKQQELSDTAKNAIDFGSDGGMSYDPDAGINDEDAGSFAKDYTFKQKKENETSGIVTRGPGERTSAILGTGTGGLN